MAWEVDGREGIATLGAEELQGAAILRYREAHLIQFRIDARKGEGAPNDRRVHDVLIIWEGDFKPRQIALPQEDG